MCLSFSKAMAQMINLWLNLQLGFTFSVNTVRKKTRDLHWAFPIQAVPTWVDLTLAPELILRTGRMLISLCTFVYRVSAGCFNRGKGKVLASLCLQKLPVQDKDISHLAPELSALNYSQAVSKTRWYCSQKTPIRQNFTSQVERGKQKLSTGLGKFRNSSGRCSTLYGGGLVSPRSFQLGVFGDGVSKAGTFHITVLSVPPVQATSSAEWLVVGSFRKQTWQKHHMPIATH